MLKNLYQKGILEFWENINILKSYPDLKRADANPLKNMKDSYDVIIFSKDRPLQLEALIESMLYYSKEELKPYIIYNASSRDFTQAYSSLFLRIKDKVHPPIDDSKSFKTCLIETLDKLTSKRMFFLVDDMVFKNHFSLEDFNAYGRDYIPSLRMGVHLKECYTQEKKQKLPKFNLEGDLYTWNYGSSQLDWAYPLSVDGHIFYTDSIRIMTKALSFKAPNSYELKLQKYMLFFKKKKGVCYEDSITLNIPCNKTQVENENKFGSFHQDDLLEIYPKKKLDFHKLQGLQNISCHQEVDLPLVDR